MEYYIGQIFEEEYPAEAAEWVNNNNAMIVEIEPVTKNIEYESFNEETQTYEKHTVEKTFRRFEIQKIPEPPAPSKEYQSTQRELAYKDEVDGITAHIQRLRDKEQTEEVVAQITELIAERDAKVEEIKVRFPYPTDPIIE